MKRETLETFSNHDLNGKLENCIKSLQDSKKKWEDKGYKDVEIEIDDEWGYYDDHYIVIKITGVKEK